MAIIDELDILTKLFDQVVISKAVWEEISLDKTTKFYATIEVFFKERVRSIQSFNELTLIMDYGESESIILYKEINADFLLIDDKKARKIAENFNINCIGTLGVLSIARTRGWIKELRPLFESLLQNNRYYSVGLLNMLLKQHGEVEIEK